RFSRDWSSDVCSSDLYIAYLMGFPEGEPRILALIALQVTLAVVFFGMGVFKGADSLVKRMPNSIKAGILIGAGFSSVSTQFAARSEERRVGKGGRGGW